MEGYHGTKPEYAKSILANNYVKIRKFKMSEEWIIEEYQSLPNDLGQGLYLFISDPNKGFDGKVSAQHYAEIYRSSHGKISIIKFTIAKKGKDEMNTLDLSDDENVRFFNQYKNKFSKKVEKAIRNTIKKNRSFERHNLDGVFLEYLLKYHPDFKFIDALMYNSYVPTSKAKPRAVSNIPNSTELCLRNITLIDWQKTKEV